MPSEGKGQTVVVQATSVTIFGEKTVAAMDVLAPGIGEIIGGSQREERLDLPDGRLAEQNLINELDCFRDLRRYATAPHSGLGMGFERDLNYVTGMENIRDAIPFPRVRV